VLAIVTREAEENWVAHLKVAGAQAGWANVTLCGKSDDSFRTILVLIPFSSFLSLMAFYVLCCTTRQLAQ
jgi:hypothetical protein